MSQTSHSNSPAPAAAELVPGDESSTNNKEKQSESDANDMKEAVPAAAASDDKLDLDNNKAKQKTEEEISTKEKEGSAKDKDKDKAPPENKKGEEGPSDRGTNEGDDGRKNKVNVQVPSTSSSGGGISGGGGGGGGEVTLTPSTTSSTTSSSAASISTSASSALVTSSQRFPVVRLNQLNMSEAQGHGMHMTRRKSTGILGKSALSAKRSASLSLETESVTAAVTAVDVKVMGAEGGSGTSGGGESQGNVDASTAPPGQQQSMDAPPAPGDPMGSGTSSTTGPGTTPSITTPSIVKPRRPSVHFALDSEPKPKAAGISERVRQDSGGSSSGNSRKHRSRKEKLVCRSESPTDIPMDTGDVTIHQLGPLFPSVETFKTPTPQPPSSSHTPPSSSSASTQSHLPPTGAAESTLQVEKETGKSAGRANTKSPTVANKTKATSKASTSNKVKQRVKRLNNGSSVSRAGNSRKSNSTSLFSGMSKEPVKKKKVIEIVSPKKTKADHFDIVKTSSDPIFVRAANKPFKNKPAHTRYKFSRANLHKSNSSNYQLFGSQQRIRRASSTSAQSSRTNKQRLSGSPQKKEPEAEAPAFPPAFVDDLIWLLQDAESEFGPPGKSSKQAQDSDGSVMNPPLSDTLLRDSINSLTQTTSASVANRLSFGRRRVESEPSVPAGFERTPGSPTGPQSFYHIRKDLYFSPSPSYAATGPTGRRRYSRRRHAKIHPPFEDTNCNFQGHYCPNPKALRSQYCEKHLDQGPSAGFNHCRFMKDGKPCGTLVQSFDTTSYCEKHANHIAKTEYEFRNPKSQPDQTRNIIAKIGKIFKEGFTKPTSVGGLDAATSVPDIFQIVEEPEIVQELPLGNYTGGLVEELDIEGERNVNPDKPDYDALKNAGYFTTEEIIQIHIHKLKKLKALYQREKELEWLTRQHKLRFLREGLEKLKQYGPRFTTNPYLINTKLALPAGYIDHQIKQYDAAKAILQTAYKADGQRGLLRLKMLQKGQEIARKAKASGQKQHDAADVFDSDTDAESDTGESRDKLESTRYCGIKSYKCAYNEGYAVRACQNPPVYWSNYCLKHILSDSKQVQWVPCKRSIGPDPQDVCKTPCFRVLEKHGCPLHSPLVMTKHKPLRRSEEELNALVDSDNEEEELTLENESNVLANLVTDECLSVSHLDEALNQLSKRGPLEVTDTSDSEETDEEVVSVGSLVPTNVDDDDNVESPISGHA